MYDTHAMPSTSSSIMNIGSIISLFKNETFTPIHSKVEKPLVSPRKSCFGKDSAKLKDKSFSFDISEIPSSSGSFSCNSYYT